MRKVFSDNSRSIGNTPLVKLNKITKGLDATILAKVEGRNPSYSIKCRVGANMLWEAEKNGILKEGMTIIEPTSGNTGIALAFVCAARGYNLILTMPETMSEERQKVLRAFGAKIVLTSGAFGMGGAIKAAIELTEQYPDKYFMPDQFSNEANPDIHFKTTGPEIFNDNGGELDYFVSGVGTGGTITGVSRYLKREKKLNVTSIAVEPATSSVLTGGAPGLHKIQGIGAGFIPTILDMDMVDMVETVTDEEAIETARRLALEEGIICGISSGATVAASMKIARRPEGQGKTIVTILADSGERYLSTSLFGE